MPRSPLTFPTLGHARVSCSRTIWTVREEAPVSPKHSKPDTHTHTQAWFSPPNRIWFWYVFIKSEKAKKKKKSHYWFTQFFISTVIHLRGSDNFNIREPTKTGITDQRVRTQLQDLREVQGCRREVKDLWSPWDVRTQNKQLSILFFAREQQWD